MIRLTFACGHPAEMAETHASVPRCIVCGETQVRRTQAPAPHFRGACSGPYADTVRLDPAVVHVARSPLRLKNQE